MADSATDIVLDLIKSSWLAHNMIPKPSIWELSFFYQNPSEKDIFMRTLSHVLRSRRGHTYLFMFKIDISIEDILCPFVPLFVTSAQ
jgi:hypothetical protein